MRCCTIPDTHEATGRAARDGSNSPLTTSYKKLLSYVRSEIHCAVISAVFSSSFCPHSRLFNSFYHHVKSTDHSARVISSSFSDSGS